MKIRKGFVSNSSSCSFIIDKKHLSVDQISAIKNHINNSLNDSLSDLRQVYDNYLKDDVEKGKITKEEAKKKAIEYVRYDEWDISEDNDTLFGYTTMANFNMKGFMKKVGVPMDEVEWRD